ncbi:MAG: hypothetical protein WAN47_11375 [Nitrosotalea sp.]
MKSRPIIILLVAIAIATGPFGVKHVSAHLHGLNFQEVQNNMHGIKMEFGQTPITVQTGKNATLAFSVQNLTGSHIRNFLAIVTITSADPNQHIPIYRFKGKVSDGDFSFVYKFPKGGHYLIALRVDTTRYITVAPFHLFVWSERYDILEILSSVASFLEYVAPLGGGCVIFGYLIFKKGKKK